MRRLPKDKLVLDVGCGTGRLLRKARTRWPSIRASGVDVAERMVAEAMTLTPEASFYTAPAEALPFPSSSVDLEVSSISLHHWSDPLIALMEIAQVLRPGGRLSLADITLPGWIAKLIDSKAKTREGLRQLVTIAGLTPVQQRTMLANIVLVLGAKKGPRIPD